MDRSQQVIEYGENGTYEERLKSLCKELVYNADKDAQKYMQTRKSAFVSADTYRRDQELDYETRDTLVPSNF